LDFDPFLNTQDPCERYEVGAATQYQQTYRVPVFSICSGKKGEQPDVTAEVAARGGRWVFINFAYPKRANDDSNPLDLLGTLKLMRESRQANGPKR
jgi:hypothetical protein